MSDIQNPYLKEIAEKMTLVHDKLEKTLNEDDTITFENFDVTWDYSSNGCVWMDIKRLITWQFKDTIKKAYEWRADQQAKKAQAILNAEDTSFHEMLKLQEDLRDAGVLYIKWDRVLDYYQFSKPELKIAKKLKKYGTVEYSKPAYGNCFGKIEAPDAVLIHKQRVGDLVVLTEFIDMEKTFGVNK